MYQFNSIGGKIDNFVNNMKGLYVFKFEKNHHRIGSLLPTRGKNPKFSKLCIYDTENECSNRMVVFSGTVMTIGLM